MVPPARRLARGLFRRCARCGGRGIFRGYFRLRDRCPTCGYRFAAEEGFFLGVWVVNFSVSEGLLFVTLMTYILAMGATGGSVPIVPALAAGLGFAVAAPVVFYPFAASTWVAVELIMDETRLRDRGLG